MPDIVKKYIQMNIVRARAQRARKSILVNENVGAFITVCAMFKKDAKYHGRRHSQIGKSEFILAVNREEKCTCRKIENLNKLWRWRLSRRSRN
jgi:hypothetical protein